MSAMRVAPVRIGDVEVLVELAQVAGTEPTSGREGLRERLLAAYALAQDTIVAVASTTVETMRRLGEAARPDRFEMELGLAFTADGNVVVAKASGQATLKVKLSYDGRQVTAGV